MHGYSYIQSSPSNSFMPARATIVLLANLTAFLSGDLGFHLFRESGFLLDRLPSAVARPLAFLPGVLCLALASMPIRSPGRLRWPVLVFFCSLVFGGVVGQLSLVPDGPVPTGLLMMLLGLSAAAWLYYLHAALRQQAQDERQLILRGPVDLFIGRRPIARKAAPKTSLPEKARRDRAIQPVSASAVQQRPQPPVPPAPPIIQAPAAAPPVDPQPANGSDPQLAAKVYHFERSYPRAGLDALAGMADLKAQIRDAIAGLRGYGCGGHVHDRNGILLSGPPGNGKSAMASAIAGELRLPLIRLGVQDLTSYWVNESPAVVKSLFRQAAQTPCVIFLDEFDSVAASRAGEDGSAEDRKVVTTLLQEIDQARAKHIVLVAATNYPERLDPAMVRDGRFDFRIEIPYPDEPARAAILDALLRKFDLHAESHTLYRVARLWERRSIAFIEATVKRLRDAGLGWEESLSDEDFKHAARAACRLPSAIPAAGARLSEIALPAAVREQGRQLVRRLRNWEHLAELGGEPPGGILLYGPPGTGKTNFVRSLARELGDWHVFEVNAAEVLADPRKFHEVVERAANHRPAFVFIDEADELLRDRTRSYCVSATNEILKTLDGFMSRLPEVVFFAATNHLELVDPAALRGGRFGERIHMDRLSGADLVAFFGSLLAQRPQLQISNDVSAARLAAEVGEIAPADAIALLNRAVNWTLTDDGVRPLMLADFRRAVREGAQGA